MDWSSILQSISQWLSSGPVGIISGLLGLGALSAAAYAISKWLDKKGFESDLDRSAAAAGRLSHDISQGMKRNTSSMEEAIRLEKEKIAKENAVEIEAPKTIEVNKFFTVKVKNLPKNRELFADKIYVLGYPQGGRTKSLAVRLTLAGKRTLDVNVNGQWISHEITVISYGG